MRQWIPDSIQMWSGRRGTVCFCYLHARRSIQNCLQHFISVSYKGNQSRISTMKKDEDDCNKTVITLKGSVTIVADFFFTAINSILYQRGKFCKLGYINSEVARFHFGLSGVVTYLQLLYRCFATMFTCDQALMFALYRYRYLHARNV